MPGQTPTPGADKVDSPAGAAVPAGPAGGRAATERLPILYVAGTPRSGSTLLDLMLNRFVGHCDVGELFHLWGSGVERNAPCACGAAFQECGFWADVGQKAYGGWSSVDAADVRRLQRRVDVTARVPLILRPEVHPPFQRDLDRYTDLLTALYRAILDVSGAKVVVDSTKRPSLAYILARAPQIDLRIVHILRDPRGVAYSWSQQVERPEGAPVARRVRKRSLWLTARRWVTVNAMIAALGRRGTPRVTLRYEDLVREPRAELGRVAALTADLTGVTDPLEFLHGDEFEPSTSHGVACGRLRAHAEPIALELDEKWRREFAPLRRRMVTVMTWPLRRVYGYH